MAAACDLDHAAYSSELNLGYLLPVFFFLETILCSAKFRHCNLGKMQILHMDFSMGRDAKCVSALILCRKLWSDWQILVLFGSHTSFVIRSIMC